MVFRFKVDSNTWLIVLLFKQYRIVCRHIFFWNWMLNANNHCSPMLILNIFTYSWNFMSFKMKRWLFKCCSFPACNRVNIFTRERICFSTCFCSLKRRRSSLVFVNEKETSSEDRILMIWLKNSYIFSEKPNLTSNLFEEKVVFVYCNNENYCFLWKFIGYDV